MQDARKAVWSIPYVSAAAFFPSLKQNFVAYCSSKCPHCIFEIHLLWQSGFNRVYSNYCCSCSFEAEMINIGQSSYKMYRNNILNVQVSMTILNGCAKKKKSGNLLNSPRIYIYIYIYIYCIIRPQIITRACFVEHDRTLFIHSFWLQFLKLSCFLFRILGSNWCKSCPMFFHQTLLTILWSSSDVVFCSGCLTPEDNQSMVGSVWGNKHGRIFISIWPWYTKKNMTTWETTIRN